MLIPKKVIFEGSGSFLSKMHLTSFPRVNIEATWQEGVHPSVLEVTTDVHTSERRAKIELTLPTQTGPLLVTHYMGLSEGALQDLIRCIVPIEKLQKKWGPSLLYDQLIDKILSEAVPLFALSDFFSSNLEKIDSEKWDQHDRLVYSELQKAPDMIDEVDALLSLRGTMTATLTLEKTPACLISEKGEISACVFLGSQQIKGHTEILKHLSGRPAPYLSAYRNNERVEEKEQPGHSIRFRPR